MTAAATGSGIPAPRFADDGARAVDSWHGADVSAYTGARGNSTVRAGFSRPSTPTGTRWWA